MSALLTTIPDAQDIFGLLRRWSPVALTGKDAGYKSAVADPERPSIVTDEGTEDVESVALDLTDLTGRSLAARWAYHHPQTQSYTGLTQDEHAAMETALHYDPMTPEQIDTLARLVLRLAGREA